MKCGGGGEPVLPATGEDEFYRADLIGLPVQRGDGSAYGRIKNVEDFGAGDVVEIALEAGGTEYQPLTRRMFPVLDPKGGRAVIAHQVVDKNSLDARELRGRIGALPEAQRVLNRLFIFLADSFGVYRRDVRAVSRRTRRLPAPVGRATTVHAAANSYAQADECEQHHGDQRPGDVLSK